MTPTPFPNVRNLILADLQRAAMEPVRTRRSPLKSVAGRMHLLAIVARNLDGRALAAVVAAQVGDTRPTVEACITAARAFDADENLVCALFGYAPSRDGSVWVDTTDPEDPTPIRAESDDHLRAIRASEIVFGVPAPREMHALPGVTIEI